MTARPLLLAQLSLSILLFLTPGEGRSASGGVLEQSSASLSRLAEEAMPGVVSIRVERITESSATGAQPFLFNNPFESFGEDFLRRFFPGQGQSPQLRPRSFRQQGTGSGFLISKDGYILSNNHVVGDADKITVRFHDGREFEAKRIGTDPKSEVALIKIEHDKCPFLPLADSSQIKVGEWVVAIGNPFGLTETLTVGVISAKGRSNIGITDYEDFIQTDAAINPGNSGGPLLNTQGEVVGINTAIYSRSGGYMGIGFAIPINMAKYVKDQLLEQGRVVRSYLGISVQNMTPDLADSFDLEEPEGVLIAEVVEGAGGDEGGLKSGDIILKLNGAPVESVGSFRNTVAANPPGTHLDLTVLREGRTRELQVITDAFPDTPIASTQDVADQLGLTVRNLTGDLAQRFGYEADTEGVVVSQVRYGSPAALAGLRPGNLITSVNRAPVSDTSDFRRQISRLKDSESVLLHVTDDQGSRFVVLDLG